MKWKKNNSCDLVEFILCCMFNYLDCCINIIIINQDFVQM